MISIFALSLYLSVPSIVTFPAITISSALIVILLSIIVSSFRTTLVPAKSTSLSNLPDRFIVSPTIFVSLPTLASLVNSIVEPAM